MANKNVIMFCTKCGEQLEVDPDIEFSFCPYCGTKNKTIKRRNDTNSIDKDPQNEMKEESNQSQSSETGFHPKKAKEDSNSNQANIVKKQILELVGNIRKLNIEQLYSVKKHLEKLKNNKLIASNKSIQDLISDSLCTVDEEIMRKKEIQIKEREYRETQKHIAAERKQKQKQQRKEKIINFLNTHPNDLITFDKQQNAIVCSRKLWKLVIALIITFAVIIVTTICISIYREDRYNWDNVILGSVMPKPDLPKGEIIVNNDDSLVMNLFNASFEDYNSYVENCVRYGFDYDIESSDSHYDAFNEPGYKLQLRFEEYDNTIFLSMEEPASYEELQWPDNDLSALLPLPKSKVGVLKESEDFLSCVIAETTLEDFNDYVVACIEKGFNVNQKIEEGAFSAQNEDEYTLTVRYVPYKTVEIELKEKTIPIVLKVDCQENWFLNTYDISCYVNGNYIGDLPHGEDKEYEVEVKPGINKLKMYSEDDWDISGEIEFEVDNTGVYYYEVTCNFSDINIKPASAEKNNDVDSQDDNKQPKETKLKKGEIMINEDSFIMEGKKYADVKEGLKSLGFTNISKKKIYDLGTSKWDSFSYKKVISVSIDGNKEFSDGDIFKKDAPIVISYHEYERNNPKIEYKAYKASTLLDELVANPMRAREKHLEEYVEITGKINTIDNRGDYILIDNPYSASPFDMIFCEITSEKQKKHLLELSKGDTVTLKGKINVVDVIYPYCMDIFSFK